MPDKPRSSESPGDRLRLQANYFRVLRAPTWQISRFHVTIEPEVEMVRFRHALIAQHKKQIGGYLFDGGQLFSIKELPTENDILVLQSKSREEQEYKITLKFTGKISMGEREAIQILNLIHRLATKNLKLQLVGRNFYDPKVKVS